MVVTDIVFIAIIGAFALVGLIRGFAKQVLGLVSGIVGIIVSFFVLSPVFNFLMGIEFVSALVGDIGASINIDLPILQAIAESAGKTQGLLVAEYIFKFVLFLVIAILCGIVLKILKKLVLAIVSLPLINVLDKLLGLVLGAAFGALVVGIVFLVLFWLKDVGPIGGFIDTLAPEGSLANQYIVANLEMINAYFTQLINFVIGKVSEVA